MGIFNEVRSATSIAQVLPDRFETESWSYLKAPNGSPFFRFDVSEAARASLLPVRGRWVLAVLIPPTAEFSRDIASMTSSGETIIGNLGRAFYDIGLHLLRQGRHLGQSFMLQAVICSTSAGDPAVTAPAGVLVGDALVAEGGLDTAEIVLAQAADAAHALGDQQLREGILAKLNWIRANVGRG